MTRDSYPSPEALIVSGLALAALSALALLYLRRGASRDH